MTSTPARPRIVDGGELPSLVDAEANTDVIAFLDRERPSCHSDAGDLLLRAAAPLNDVVAYSPSFASCRYVAIITSRQAPSEPGPRVDGCVIAVGDGQRSVTVRLPATAMAEAARAGGTQDDRLGPDWMRFELFHADRPPVDLARWLREADLAARADARPSHAR